MGSAMQLRVLSGTDVRTYSCEGGENLLTFLQEKGYAIAASCGGNGKCGKCKVRVLEGGVEGQENGYAYACLAHISRDAYVEVFETKERATISEYMSRFDGIGVREADGVKICKDVYGVDAVQVLDPVFAADREIFDELTEKAAANNRPDKDEKYICTYILDYSEEKKEAVKWISQQLGIKVINLLDGIPWNFAKNKQAAMGMGEIPENVQVEDWLYYIKKQQTRIPIFIF